MASFYDDGDEPSVPQQREVPSTVTDISTVHTAPYQTVMCSRPVARGGAIQISDCWRTIFRAAHLTAPFGYENNLSCSFVHTITINCQ
jgi:hypothetical protein